MNKQKGITLIELTIVLALATVALAVTAAYSLPMLARETMRSSAYDVQTAFQLGRIEAVTRNRDCWLTLHRDERWIKVEDTTGELLHRITLPDTVTFARPDAGNTVTLPKLGPVRHRVIFHADGTVKAGGDVFLYGGEHYRRVSLFGAGGVQVNHWDGSAWVPGS